MNRPNSPDLQLTVVAPDHGSLLESMHSSAFELGVAGAKQNCGWLLPTTVGLAHRVAQGASSVGGMTVGLSPADSKLTHDTKYRLPQANYDSIIYTGLPVSTRDQTLLRSADGVIFVGDRAPSPQLFAVAVELECVIGVLLESDSKNWYQHFSETLKEQLMSSPKLLFDQDPKKLVTRLKKHLAD